MFRLMLLSGAVICVSFAAMSPAAVTKTENFTTDPNWTGVGNTSNGNNYGYKASPSNVAGGTAAGEAGGTFARVNSEDYYADTASFADGAFNLSHHLQGSGKFDATNTSNMNNVAHIGHRSSSTSDRSFMGLAVLESNINLATSIRVGAILVLGDSTALLAGFDNVPINSDYSFSYTYDPYAGVNGKGRLSLLVSSTLASYSNTFVVDLTAANRVTGATFNAFGIGGSPASTLAVSGDVFIDDVTYTVPEPALGFLLAIAGVALAHRRR